MKFIITLMLLLSYSSLALSSNKGDELAQFGAQSFEYQGESYLALSLKNEPHWHTYWKNPGDAGIPFSAVFQSDKKVISLEELEWPVPKKYILEGNILSYGYEGLYSFFYKIPKNLNSSTFSIKGHWLICKELCVPGERVIEGEIKNNSFKPTSGNEIEVDKNKLISQLKSLPKAAQTPSNLQIQFFVDEKDKLLLHYTLDGIDLNKYNSSMSLLTPFPTVPFGHKLEKLFYDDSSKELVAITEVDWDGAYQEPTINFPSDGKLPNPIAAKFLFNNPVSGNIEVIEYSIKDFALKGAKEIKKYVEKLKPIKHLEKFENQDLSLLTILFFAFLGGLILNLMPCVLPVISLKLFGLIVHSGASKKKIIKHNIFYMIGVIATFWALALAVIGIKAAGEEIGWGFQLQSPLFVFLMMLFIFILSLNLFGFFEFRTPGGKVLGDKQLEEGVFGDFMSGVIATILSTPCSAPFLGSALSFAFTTSIFNIFLVFTFIALGLSFPFLLTAFFPSLISFLPKPGKWMETFKKFLGFTLLITSLWLYAILLTLTDSSITNIYFNLILVTIFLFFWLQRKMKNRSHIILMALIPMTSFVFVILNQQLYLAPTSSSMESHHGQWETWSEETMASHKGQEIFVDFTAQWCLTCKVNKKLVMDTNDFYEFSKARNLKLMRADWTKRDDRITEFLKRYNVVGVPAYFIQKKNGEIKYLGETISIGKIKENL